MKWLKQAFAVDAAGAAAPTPAQQPAVDWVCTQIAKRHLTTPSLIALEMCRPLNWLGAQAMQFARPGVWAIASQLTYRDYVHFTEFLEHRGSVDHLARRVEYFESEFTRLQKDGQPVGAFIQRHMKAVRAEAARATPTTEAEDQAT